MADYSELVAQVKSDLVARGVNLAGPCGAFEITRRVAYARRSEVWGFVAAPAGGEHCNGFRSDKLVSIVGGVFVDLLIDAGGANSPAWQERQATPAEIAAWRPIPQDDPDAHEPPPPPPPPPPAEPTDNALVRAVTALEAIAEELNVIGTYLRSINAHAGEIAEKGLRFHV